MVRRRLVNLAMTDYNNRMFSLHRMDLSKLLFYPSTAAAEAAAGGNEKPPKIGRLHLPPPVMSFDPFPTARDPSPFMCAEGNLFALLHGRRHGRRRTGGGEPGRILFANREGQASMFDLDARSVVSVPDLSAPTRTRGDMPKHVVITGAGAGAGEEEDEGERLYVMRAGGHFEMLDLTGGGGAGDKTFSTSRTLTWQSLPPLPVADDPYVCSSTVVDGGRTICESFSRSGGSVTFCFDTASEEWRHAGDWVLPFDGGAEHVPELDTWLGFSGKHHAHYLCAADLSGVGVAAAMAPALRHVWEYFEPPPTEETSREMFGVVLTRTVYWQVDKRFLVNLGSGRFCVAKVVNGDESVSACWTLESHHGSRDTFTVLTGVEVLRGGGDGELRMVKHKTRVLVHPGLDVACVL